MIEPKYYMSKETFSKIESGDKLVTRFMGICYAVSNPTLRNTTDEFGSKIKQDVIKVRFKDGPWAKKNNGEFELIRQQIKRIA